ncbi:hypothetical protein ACMA5K_05735 [Bradyrhizobium diazoefficiens]|uniref:hypothetical protein n=1 Tax=Bradyrhizobium diazoefficiens TaxID=1355477 RepID=UPI0015B4B2B3|nr:hypothetical protein [Bradyrhizobium diazoefficiens]QLD40516.1 hypothetical protein HUW42_05675 [Bradyrhizobium diazoefficiens]
MSNTPNTITSLRDPWQASFARALVGHARTLIQPGMDDGPHLTRALYPHDPTAATLAETIKQRSAITLADSGNLTALNRKVSRITDPVMGQTAAFNATIRDAVQLTFDGAQSVFVTGQSASTTAAGFVKRGDAIPPVGFDLSTGITLEAGKEVKTITVLSEEAVLGPNADVLIQAKMTADGAAAIEKLFYDTTAGTDTRPAGSRAGVAKINATAATGGAAVALAGDLAALGGAIAVCGPAIIYAAGPATALRARLLAPLCPYPILSSRGIDENILIAMAPSALVVATDGEARIEISKEATLHMDSSPTQLSGNATATPVQVAFPIRGLFQTRCVAIKLALSLTWGWRGAGVSWTDTINW